MTDEVTLTGESQVAPPATDRNSHTFENPMSAPLPNNADELLAGVGDTTQPTGGTEADRGPIPYQRFSQVNEAKKAAEVERDALRQQYEQRELAWQNQFQSLQESIQNRDPVAALREALIPQEEEDPDPLVREVRAEQARTAALEKELQDMKSWRESQEQQAYQRDVGAMLNSAINSLQGVSDGGRSMVHKAVLTDLVSYAEDGRAVTPDVINSFVGSYAKVFAPQAAPVQQRTVQSQGVPPAQALMSGGQSAAAPQRTRINSIADADEHLEKLLERGDWG